MKHEMKTTNALVERFPALGRVGSRARKKVPFVAQHSNVECGVACMAMVLAYHGKHVAREELRSVLGPTRDGVRAAHLLRAARHYGLCARGVKAEIDALGHLPRGSILHWQFNHYVVLQAIGRGYIDIVDPARGPRRVLRDELEDVFTGVALIFEPGADFEASDSRPERRGLYANMLRSGDWGRILSVSFAAQLVTLALPLLVAMIVDRVLPRSDSQLLYVVACGLGLLVLFYWLTQIVRGHLLLHLRSVLDAKLSLQLVDRLLALPYAFFQQRTVGDLILRLESSKMIREVLTAGALSAVLDGTMMLLYIGLLVAVSPLLTAVVLGLGGLNVLMLLAMRGRRHAFHAELLDRQAASESYQYEMLNAIETIKGMGGEQRALDRFGNLFVDLLNNQVAYGRLEILFSSLTTVLRLGAPLVIFTLGATEVLAGSMSIGTMLAINTFAVGIFDPLSRLVEKLEQFERMQLYVDRMLDVYDSPREQALGKAPLTEPLRGAIELADVAFRHGPLDRDVVSQISVSIRPGEFVAIVGPSGAGKSTLANLMLGLYQPTAGRILYDGRSMQEIELGSLRAQVGLVTQQCQLFSGSIRANIANHDPEISADEIERAARLALIHDDIARMPAGYDTILGTGGNSLSGGQRQRIALARALVRRPAILVLDEATSALDSASEAGIQAALEGLRCTRIVIAHRLSTVARADRILVVDQGQIVEQGVPLELLQRGAMYARLVAQQQGAPLPLTAAAPPATALQTETPAEAAPEVTPDLVIAPVAESDPVLQRGRRKSLSSTKHGLPLAKSEGVAVVVCQLVGVDNFAAPRGDLPTRP
jgi:ATP-binding cassette, subfamily B, bacterial